MKIKLSFLTLFFFNISFNSVLCQICIESVSKSTCELIKDGEFDEWEHWRSWEFITRYDIAHRDWFFYPNSSNVQLDCENNKISIIDFKDEIGIEVFDILHLDNIYMYLYNETWCPDTCTFVNHDIWDLFDDNDYYKQAEEELCSQCPSNQSDCFQGVCECPFGTIGKFCKDSYQFSDLGNEAEIFLVFDSPFDTGFHILYDNLSSSLIRVNSQGETIWRVETKSNHFPKAYQRPIDNIFLVKEYGPLIDLQIIDFNGSIIQEYEGIKIDSNNYSAGILNYDSEHEDLKYIWRDKIICKSLVTNTIKWEFDITEEIGNFGIGFNFFERIKYIGNGEFITWITDFVEGKPSLYRFKDGVVIDKALNIDLEYDFSGGFFTEEDLYITENYILFHIRNGSENAFLALNHDFEFEWKKVIDDIQFMNFIYNVDESHSNSLLITYNSPNDGSFLLEISSSGEVLYDHSLSNPLSYGIHLINQKDNESYNVVSMNIKGEMIYYLLNEDNMYGKIPVCLKDDSNANNEEENEEEENEQQELIIEPNPFQSIINFNYVIDDAEVFIFNTSGLLELRAPMSQSLDLSSLDTGMYFIMISSEEEVIARKIFKL